MPEFNAVIIAGGRATRLGGIDKTALLYNGRSLLQCALDAVRDAKQIAVVGFGIALEPTHGVSLTTEEPRWSGPAAALTAGMQNLRHSRVEHTIVIAADMPRVGDAVARLLAAVDHDHDGDHDGVIAIDSTGARQQVLAVYRTSALRQAVAASGAANAAMRAITGGLRLRELAIPDEYCTDVDTPLDAIANGIELRTHALAG